MTITRLTGGLTPGDGADPRTFPAIFNATADEIEAQGTAIADLEDLNPVQFGTAVASGGQVLAFSTAVSGFEPADVFGVAVNGTAVYRFVSTVYFTSSGTFSKADYPWLRAIRVKCQGAGGGGAGVPTTAVAQMVLGSAGSGGAYAESFITDIAGLASSVTVTRGAGGAGGAAGQNNGSDGGSSSFGASVSADGGTGGLSNGAGALLSLFPQAQKTGATGGTGDLIIPGDSAMMPYQSRVDFIYSPISGGSFLGGSKVSGNQAQNGVAGSAFGGGGTGGQNTQSQATARSGGAGGNGIVIVELYA